MTLSSESRRTAYGGTKSAGPDMSSESQGVLSGGAAPGPEPTVRVISVTDINEAWAQGLRDFRAAPGYGLVFGGVYAAAGILIVLSAAALGLSYLAYPLAAGFALIGPFAAVGLYEVSRRREANMELTWRAVLGAIFEQRHGQLAWMGFVTFFFFMVWIYQVQLFIALFLGTHTFADLHEFLIALTTTPAGLLFLLLGNGIGALLSIVLFSLTFVSFPLLLEHDVDLVTAMITSVRAVITNPLPALGWAITIVLLLLLASLPFFLGLVVVLPILGHATWHLYRKLVVSGTTERAPEQHA
jgi:uncharacterized membrane protein